MTPTKKAKPDRRETRRVNFTQKLVESVPIPESGRIHMYDRNVQELGLRVEATGRRTFFWFRRVRRKPKWISIGRVETTTVEKAREFARKTSVKADDWKRENYQGENPFGPSKTDTTFQQLVNAYIERYVRSHGKRPERDEVMVNRQVDGYLKDWKNRKLSEISAEDVDALHAKLGKTGKKYAANRTVALIRLLFNWGMKAKLYRGENPGRGITMFPEEKRKRFLNHEELSRLFAALKIEPSADLRDFVLLALWTGARKSDVFSMRWDNISFPDRRWEIPDPKKEPYAVPITVEAEEVLKDRLKRRRNESPWVFPSHGPAGHILDLKARWASLLKRAKIENFRIHDLRRTQGSWQAAAGASLSIIGKSLGHSSTAATAVYARLDLDPVRQSMTAVNAAMLAAMKTKPKQLRAPRT
jgi:integrase